jgi:hypothetical protein
MGAARASGEMPDGARGGGIRSSADALATDCLRPEYKASQPSKVDSRLEMFSLIFQQVYMPSINFVFNMLYFAMALHDCCVYVIILCIDLLDSLLGSFLFVILNVFAEAPW